MTHLYQLRRATTAPCPPCNSNCAQGDFCPAHNQAGSACSELLEDERDPYDETALFRGVLSALGIVAVCVALGYILPLVAAALK